jgi:hypothetical protein
MDRNNDEKVRKGLLAQVAPDPARLEDYEMEVRAMIDKKARALKRERRVSSSMWLFLVVLSTTFLLLGGRAEGDLRLWFGIQACFWFLFGAVFVLRYFLNRNRLEFLTEIKGLELRVAELAERLETGGDHPDAEDM